MNVQQQIVDTFYLKTKDYFLFDIFVRSFYSLFLFIIPSETMLIYIIYITILFIISNYICYSQPSILIHPGFIDIYSDNYNFG